MVPEPRPFRYRTATRSARNAGATGALSTLCGCHAALLDPAGPVARSERLILFDALVIMLAIIVPVIIATIAFAWWFRAGNARAQRAPEWTYSGRIEIIVWSIPTLVIMFLGGIAWTGSRDLDPARPLSAHAPPLEIQVVALDWKWLFIYPHEGIAALNLLRVPAGTPLRLRVTSASVLNVFFVPRLGSEIYGMYGMATQLYLQADAPGIYPGLAAHFNGDGFSGMRFELEAVTPEAFASWQGAMQRTQSTLDESAYDALRRQSESAPATHYGRVKPGLFEAIVMQRLPPGAGPALKQPGAAAPRTEP